MTTPRVISLWALLLIFIPAFPLSACDVPLGLLSGRALPETREILEGRVVFVADARLHDFEGQTTAVSGVVRTRELQDAVGCVAIEAKSLDTGIDRRNELMWENYLEVAKFPQIRFILTGLADRQQESNKMVLTLEGELTVHGVTRNARIPVSLSPGNGRLEIEGRTILKMSDYAIERPSFLFITVKDEVEVHFRVVVGEVE